MARHWACHSAPWNKVRQDKNKHQPSGTTPSRQSPHHLGRRPPSAEEADELPFEGDSRRCGDFLALMASAWWQAHGRSEPVANYPTDKEWRPPGGRPERALLDFLIAEELEGGCDVDHLQKANPRLSYPWPKKNKTLPWLKGLGWIVTYQNDDGYPAFRLSG